MDQKKILQETESFVKQTLDGAEAGHDWSHIQRVVQNARLITPDENADPFIVEMAALLHDIADSKFHDGNEQVGPERALVFLKTLNLPETTVNHIVNIIKQVSFKNELEKRDKSGSDSIELKVVKDADRLDAVGAIGVARAFHYGGYKNRQIYDPAIAPILNQTKEQYKSSSAPTINHFYEKLLLLKDKMHTITGKKIAVERHKFMELFLEQFYREWEGKR